MFNAKILAFVNLLRSDIDKGCTFANDRRTHPGGPLRTKPRVESMITSPLSKAEIAAWKPYALPAGDITAIELTRQRLQKSGQWAPWQMMGRRMAIGCVALEITQRCNLDCSYCYLSESSEALKDIPIEEVFRRVDLIRSHYGEGTDVQVTGGEPTLRARHELVAIVRYIKTQGMRSSLLTNGIRATRALLAELCEAGLEDVAFHVDMTQERKGFASETELNLLREQYIERVRGLPLAVIFNTTAFPGNFRDIPGLVKFFIRHADIVRFASFQVGADTGRGVERERVAVNADTVKQAICEGAGASLNFNAASAGHAECNGYAYGLIVNGKVHDFFRDIKFVQEILATSAPYRIDRADRRRIWKTVGRYLFAHPRVFAGIAVRFASLLWNERRDFIEAKGKVGKISFFVHNFMDASQLDRTRCESCSFMVMTPEGPMSMCVHNAKRDAYLLVTAKVQRAEKMVYFNPVSGTFEDQIPDKIAVNLTRKNARGKFRVQMASSSVAPIAQHCIQENP